MSETKSGAARPTQTDVIERTETLTPGPAQALVGLLGVPQPLVEDGLPLLWHWLYLLERPAQSDLGPDGHPASGGIPSPPGPGRRRMFAGGRVESLRPLYCDRPATRRTFVRNSNEKIGRSGRLTFVTVAHEISQDGRLAIAEEQDIVYRDAAPASPDDRSERPADPVPDAQPVGPDEWSVVVDPVLLFRFSALTYNGHRIHYDRDYARDVEDYPGLVVHGPLQAILMAEAVRRRRPSAPGTTFSYRLLSPLFDHEGMVVSATQTDTEFSTSIRDHAGRTTANGTMRAQEANN